MLSDASGIEPLFREKAGGKRKSRNPGRQRESELPTELLTLVRRCSGLSLPELEERVRERGSR